MHKDRTRLRCCTAATLALFALTLAGAAAANDTAGGLTAEYFDNPDLTVPKVARVDPVIDFVWDTKAPDPAIQPDYFSVRWSGSVEPRYSETYTFHANASDGVRLWIDGRLVIDKWRDRGITEVSGTIALQAGRRYPLKLEYYESINRAVIQFAWSSASQPKEIVPQSRLAPGTPPAPGTAPAPPPPPVPTPIPTAPPPAPSVQPGTGAPAPAPAGGIWASAAEIAALPLAGTAYVSTRSAAWESWTLANLADQNSAHDTSVLAAALVAARTGDLALRVRAVNGILAAIGTEQGARWLAIGRNLGAYVLAADVLGLHGHPVIDPWFAGFFTKKLAHNNDSARLVGIREAAWNSASNASAQEGFVHAALAAYFRRADELAWAWDGYRRYIGDRSSPHRLSSNADAWQELPSDPVGIQPRGASRNGCRLDGAVSNDMARGGLDVCTPGYTQYPWVGLSGAIPAAVVLDRAGFPAWTHMDSALRRSLEYLWAVRQATGNAAWFDGKRAAAAIYLANRAYAAAFPVVGPTGADQTVGFTDWSHAPGGARVG